MTAPAKINFKVYQGATFEQTLRWESPIKEYKSISGITKSAPIEITSANHGIPVGWRVLVTNVVGMKEINSADTYQTVTSSTQDTVILNAVNALGYTDYISGGVLEFNKPIDLTGFTARMQLRGKITDEVVLHEMTTENSGILLDNTLKTITLYIPASITTEFDFSTAVYSLELISSGLQVTPFINGSISLIKEVTR